MHQNKIPGGWCCGGGQGPIPPVPPATASPGIVMTLILSLPSLQQRRFLLLVSGHVSVKGALQTENSIYIPLITSTAYETILYDGSCINHAVYDNGTDETVQANVKECITVYLSTVNYHQEQQQSQYNLLCKKLLK